MFSVDEARDKAILAGVAGVRGVLGWSRNWASAGHALTTLLIYRAFNVTDDLLDEIDSAIADELDEPEDSE